MFPIRYSNCWEDTDVLLSAINAQPGGDYLSIASAGDNTLALLSRNPKSVLAVDISASQIASLEIRRAAFQMLEYQELLEFIGVVKYKSRLERYVKLRRLLSPNARYFWDKNPLYIEHGLIHCGKVETYLKRFRNWALPLLMSRRKQRRLLAPRPQRDDAPPGDVFYSWRWQIFTRLFFNKIYLARIDLGRSKAIYQNINKDIPALVLARIQHAMTAAPAEPNPYLEYIIRGNYHEHLPYYLQEDNYSRIRNNLSRLKIFAGSLEQALDNNPEALYRGFNLSDIFEYMDAAQFIRTFKQILGRCRPGARIVYWNNLIDRIPSAMPGRINLLNDLARDLFARNRSFFYGSLVIAEATAHKSYA